MAAKQKVVPMECDDSIDWSEVAGLSWIFEEDQYHTSD